MQSLPPVLLLEDDTIDAMSVKRAFKENNITNQIIHFLNGEEALSYIEKNTKDLNPALILLDLNMPRMGGFEFLEALQQRKILPKVPVIILTTSTEREEQKRSSKFEVYDFLAKPVDYKNYSKLIRSFINLLSTST